MGLLKIRSLSTASCPAWSQTPKLQLGMCPSCIAACLKPLQPVPTLKPAHIEPDHQKILSLVYCQVWAPHGVRPGAQLHHVHASGLEPGDGVL